MDNRDKLVFTDVHGCGDELERLIASNSDCDFISLGDNFDRAFNGVKVWELLREYEVKCIQGNHDLKLLHYLEGSREWIPKSYQYFLREFLKKYTVKELVNSLKEMVPIHSFHMANRRMIAVHAGIVLDDPLAEDISCNVYGRSPDQPEDWWNFYNGRDVVLYGHIVHDSVFITRRGDEITSMGLDTGACHGKSLSAVRLFTSGSAKIVSTPSNTDYFKELKERNYLSV